MNIFSKITLSLLMLGCANGIVCAQDYQKTSQGVKIQTQEMDVAVEFYTPGIVRVYKTPKDHPYRKESLVVIKSPEQVPVRLGEKGKNS